MRLGRIASPDGVAFVSIEGEPDAVAPRIAEHPFGTPTFTGRSWPLADVRLLAPILASKVVYGQELPRPHQGDGGPHRPGAGGSGHLPQASIIGPGVPIQLPANASPVHHEGELAVVIGKPCKDVAADRAGEVILGYTIANDVSAVISSRPTASGCASKGHDTFCPVGPWIVTDLDPSDLEIRTEVNGQLRQRALR